MDRLPVPSPRSGPHTTAQTRCRRLGREYVDILGLSEGELAERYLWCVAQAELLEGVPKNGLAERLCKEWNVSAAEAAWVVRALG